MERNWIRRGPDQRGADVGPDVHDPAAGAAVPHAGLRVVLRAGRRLRRRHVLGRLQRAQRLLHVCKVIPDPRVLNLPLRTMWEGL